MAVLTNMWVVPHMDMALISLTDGARPSMKNTSDCRQQFRAFSSCIIETNRDHLGGHVNITWIVGNGFDLNLGLRTGYGQFVKDVYLSTDQDNYPPEKQSLIEAVDGLPEWGTDKWSDLEMLLGRVTTKYSLATIDSFAAAFEDMEEQLRQHLISENEGATSFLQSKQAIEETWSSIAEMCPRLSQGYRKTLKDYPNIREQHTYCFITLNYTHTLDLLLEEAEKLHAPFARRKLNNTNYDDRCQKPIHVHGTIEEQGGIVFGVSNASQIANKELAENEDFTEIWVKQRRNEFFGNTLYEQTMSVIADTSVFVIYGCSLGATDEYIWRAITNRLARTDAAAIVFDPKMPEMGTTHTRLCQKTRNNLRSLLLSYSDAEDETKREMANRIVVANSGILFKFEKMGINHTA